MDCSSAPTLRADAVQDVILGHCYPSMEAPLRSAVSSGSTPAFPVTVPGMQLDRRCGSGLQAVIQACMQVATGQHDLVVRGRRGIHEQRGVPLHRHALGRIPRRGQGARPR